MKKSRTIIDRKLVLLSFLLFFIATANLSAQQFVKKDLSSPVVSNSNTILCYGHFNNDNHIDFIAHQSGSVLENGLVMLINDGSFNGTPRYFELDDREVGSLKSGDINGDGLDDLVLFDKSTKEIIWYESEYLKFRQKTVISEGAATGFTPIITVHDVNDDGFADVIYNTGTFTRIRYGQNFGLGNEKTIHSNRQDNILLDYNQDGLIDFPYLSETSASVYLQGENESFSNIPLLTTEKQYEYGTLINIDDDPELEIIRSFKAQSSSTPGTTGKYDLVYFDNGPDGIDTTEQLLLSNLDQVMYISAIRDASNLQHKLAIETYERIKVGNTFPDFTFLNIYSAVNGELNELISFDHFDDYHNIEVVDLDNDELDEVVWSSNDGGLIGFFDNDDKLTSINPSNLDIQDFTIVENDLPNDNETFIFNNNISKNLFQLTIDNTGKYVLEEDNALLDMPGTNLGKLSPAHLNLDDKIDFVYSDVVLNGIGLYIAYSNGNIYTNKVIDETLTIYDNITFADFDLDGDVDIVASYNSSFQPGVEENKLIYYKNMGSEDFEKIVIDENQMINSLSLIKLNDGDDYQNIVIDGYLYKNDGGTFTKIEINDLANKKELIQGDIDMDGDEDLISVEKMQYASNYDLYIHRQNSDQSFTSQNIGFLPHILGFDNSRNINLIDLVDLDGDGDLDIPLFYDRNSTLSDTEFSQIHWLENKQDEGFESHMIDPNIEVDKCQVLDLDQDGSQDILCLTSTGGLRAYFNSANKSKLIVNAFFDKNENGTKEEDEDFYPDFQILIDGINMGQTELVDDGKLLFLDEGGYTITYDDSYNSDFSLTTEMQLEVDLTLGNTNQSILFGIKPNILRTSFLQSISHGYPRCGKTIPLSVEVKNNGTETLSGELVLDIDPLVDDITVIEDLFLDESGNQLTYTISDLLPGYTLIKNLYITVPSISDGIELGDELDLILESNLEGNGETVSKLSEYSPEIRCSFDPNDKAAFPDRSESLLLFSEDILFNIRFQNTGNDTAYNISIYDTLSEHLDHNSFELLGTSHREKLTVEQTENVIHFKFDNIYLPDSNINESASHGFVSFKINSVEGVAENTELTNKAHIYFDENPAIVTNQTENILVSTLVSTKDDKLTSSITISPNPTNGIFQIIDQEQKADSYEIRDISGRLLTKSAMTTEMIDLSSYQSGLYYIAFQNSSYKTIQVNKIVIMK